MSSSSPLGCVLLFCYFLVSLIVFVSSGLAHRPCNTTSDVVNYYNRHYRTEFGNKADHAHAQRLSRQFQMHSSSDIVIMIGGLNKGSMLQNMLACRNERIIAHGFEIQNSFVETARRFYRHHKSVHIHHLGWSNISSEENVSGTGETAGLYDIKKLGSKFPGQNNHETVRVVPPTEFAMHYKILNVTYMLIDVEGYESTVIQGMHLENELNSRIFPVIQFELGGTWIDSRRPAGSPNMQETVEFLTLRCGYDVYLIGEHSLLPVDRDFFENILSTDPFVEGNALAIHPLYAPRVVADLIEPVDCSITQKTRPPIIKRCL